MFIYLIIAIELTVLYIVFWVIFLREPRPKEIRAELWGHYFKSADRSNNNIVQAEQHMIDGEQLDFYLPSILPSPHLYRTVKMKKIRRKKSTARRSSRSNLYCHLCSGTDHNRYAHQQASLPQQASRTVVEKFLLSLNRALNKLSVKVP